MNLKYKRSEQYIKELNSKYLERDKPDVNKRNNEVLKMLFLRKQAPESSYLKTVPNISIEKKISIYMQEVIVKKFDRRDKPHTKPCST